MHHEGTKDTKVQEYYFLISYFVLFVSFVVRCLLRFWLRLCRAGCFVVTTGIRTKGKTGR